MAADITIGIENALKRFNNGVGVLNFPIGAVTLDSAQQVDCELPYGSEATGVMVALGSTAGAALIANVTLFTMALIAETTTPTPPIVSVTLADAAGVEMGTTGFILASVVM